MGAADTKLNTTLSSVPVATSDTEIKNITENKDNSEVIIDIKTENNSSVEDKTSNTEDKNLTVNDFTITDFKTTNIEQINSPEKLDTPDKQVIDELVDDYSDLPELEDIPVNEQPLIIEELSGHIEPKFSKEINMVLKCEQRKYDDTRSKDLKEKLHALDRLIINLERPHIPYDENNKIWEDFTKQLFTAMKRDEDESANNHSNLSESEDTTVNENPYMPIESESSEEIDSDDVLMKYGEEIDMGVDFDDNYIPEEIEPDLEVGFGEDNEGEDITEEINSDAEVEVDEDISDVSTAEVEDVHSDEEGLIYPDLEQEIDNYDFSDPTDYSDLPELIDNEDYLDLPELEDVPLVPKLSRFFNVSDEIEDINVKYQKIIEEINTEHRRIIEDVNAKHKVIIEQSSTAIKDLLIEHSSKANKDLLTKEERRKLKEGNPKLENNCEFSTYARLIDVVKFDDGSEFPIFERIHNPTSIEDMTYLYPL